MADEGLVRRATEGVHLVFHLACTTLPATSNSDLRTDLSSNVLPTLGLLEAARASGVRRLVFISSGGTVYGLQHQASIAETHETDPICGYGIHKLAIEKYLFLYRYQYGLDYRILRLSNPYGAGQVCDRPQGVIGRFLYQALHDRPLEVWGAGTTVRDYLYIDDAVAALTAAATHCGPSRLFNVGSGRGHSLLDIIQVIETVLGHRLEVGFKAARTVDLPTNVLDISRAKEELGWRPVVDLATGIDRLCAAYRRGADARRPCEESRQ
jgi:UDP-glucose 4-epimerase